MKPRNLATAALELEQELQIISQHSIQVNQVEMKTLLELRERIRAIEHTLKTWQKGHGQLARFWLSKAIPDARPYLPRQNDLIQEARMEHEKALNFTYIMLKKLCADLDLLLKKKWTIYRYDRNKLFSVSWCLDDIKINAEGVLETLMKEASDEEKREDKEREDKNTQRENIKIKLSVLEHSLFSLKNSRRLSALELVLKRVNQLDGIYLPISQSTDPLRGTHFAGECQGMVLIWCKEIEKTGKCLLLPRVDLIGKVLSKRLDEKVITVDDLQEEKETTISLRSFIDDANRNVALTQIFQNAKVEGIFQIGLTDSRVEIAGHVMGYRVVPKTEEVEFFDPNLGIIVFPDHNKFSIWFIEEVLGYYSQHDYATFDFEKIGQQPENAVVTIPLQIRASSDGENLRPNSSFSARV